MITAGAMVISREIQKGGLISGTTLGNIITTNSYSDFTETSNYNAQYNGADIYNVDYIRDKLGRIISKTETINSITTIYEYDYDLSGRLVEEKTNSVITSTWDYDLNGNRTHIDGNQIATYDDQDRLLTYDGNIYTYTDNGELLTKTNGMDITSYNYDVLGNLLSVTQPDGTLIEYMIDPKGRRVGKKVNGNLVKGWLYKDKLNPIAEIDAVGNIVSRFIYAEKSNIPSYMVNSGTTYKIITNQLGSPLKIVDIATGTVAQEMSYDIWGNILSDSNIDFQPFGFAGGIYDPDTKLTRFGYRDYDAEIARWTSKDPIKFNAGDTNLFGYVFNDPINFVDENGLIPAYIAWGLGVGVAQFINSYFFQGSSFADALISAGFGFASVALPIYKSVNDIASISGVRGSIIDAVYSTLVFIAEQLITNTDLFISSANAEEYNGSEGGLIFEIKGDCKDHGTCDEIKPVPCP